ncbi:MAG: ribonuclease H-like domain-containing protein [Nanoarchaeota archaeon]|nr:ribonuclease H-like domain-containing protein [Nanoarchaeota archaeon]
MADKIRFFPLDVMYKVIDNKPVIHLFGKTVDNKQICVLYDSFEPYFYVIPKKGFDIADELKNFKFTGNNQIYSITKIETVKKKYLGKDVNAIKVFTKLPRDVPIIREELKNIKNIESINENDILFVRRFLIDKNIVPMTLYEAEGIFGQQNLKVPSFKAEKIESYGTETFLQPKILSVDIETYTPQYMEIEPEKNPILMISFYAKDFQKVFVWKRFKNNLDYIEFVDSEEALIKKFKETIEIYKPDILTGYFSDGFDLPYIKARADKYKIKLDLGLDFSEIKIEKRRDTTVQITGITHLDIFKFIRKVISGTLETETYNLNAVASELLDEKKHDVDLNELSKAWDNNEEIKKFCEYNLNDAKLSYKLAEKLMPTISEMVKITGLTIYDVNRMGFSQLVEWYLLRQAPNFNEIAPNKPSNDDVLKRRLQTYKGAFVFEPKPGLYNNIVVFDYRSLYPTIIGSHNIGPGTLNCSCCQGEATYAPTEDNKKIWFCNKKKSFISTLIEDLITRRTRIKEIIKDQTDEKFAILDARQNSLKLLANSFYGYLGFFMARWYSIECAQATTAFGRYYIKDVNKKAEKFGFRVIYGDTDSLFITLGDKSKEDAETFSEKINRELPGLMELEFEGFYPSGIFVSAKVGAYGAKKKYALIDEKGILKIKGFESVRRNWSLIAKEVQEKVLNVILKEHNDEKAFEYVKKVIDDLRNKRIPLEKVIIHTQLQKEISDYDSRGPHVAVAQRLKNKGINVGPGSMIKFVVTQGSDIIRNRSKLPEEIKEEDYDSDYYIHNQVVPAVERIFNVLGYKKEELLEIKDQTKLEGFF